MSWDVMGIINATPDSFSDGGLYEDLFQRAEELIKSGATVIDVGGESTRPGAHPVGVDEEMKRVIPLVEHLSARGGVTISVDTTKSEVARAALLAGAHWINDVSAGRFDPRMADLLAEFPKSKVILMHSRENPQTMQNAPSYRDVVDEVYGELLESTKKFIDAGVKSDSIMWDPGIGFAKSLEHNISLIKNLSVFSATYPVVMGTSRKSFIGSLTGRDVSERLAGSLATVATAYMGGAFCFRVHDVAETVDFLRVFEATLPGDV